ncbi:hypothetical protein HAX54_043723, partial [Datura stramonium]|nr:hypothetical protein [Datura stramonium]
MARNLLIGSANTPQNACGNRGGNVAANTSNGGQSRLYCLAHSEIVEASVDV